MKHCPAPSVAINHACIYPPKLCVPQGRTGADRMHCAFQTFLETAAPTLVTPKEEPKAEGSRASSEQGEEEMEVDSNEEPDEDGEARAAAGAAFSNTLSSLSTLRPGMTPPPQSFIM